MRLHGSWLVWTLALSFALGMGLSGTARALAIDPDPRSFNDSGVAGTITLTASVNGIPSGGSVELGSVDASDITLVFEVSVTTGTLNGVGAAAFLPPFGAGSPSLEGAGVIDNSGEDVTGVSASGSNGAVFEFLSGGSGTLSAGETSDEFFISYESLATDGSLVVNFMISPADGSSDFTVTSTIVPEPGLAVLGGAAVFLSFVWRRTRRA